jgi:acyl-CoA dehydrogenase
MTAHDAPRHARDDLVASFRRWRRELVTRRLMPVIGRRLPRLGDTEREALEAGSVGWDGELFRGSPDWQRLLAFRVSDLSRAERAFLDGPLDEICRGLDDWDVYLRGDLPPEIWERLRSERCFGMIIPEEWGGLGFSAQAHSAVIVKLASRSVACAVTVMVPNSLGPAELLLRYGTDAQKQHYLPRLAQGVELPCFALTGPEAGSDAAATQSEGIVCHGKWDGDEVLGMRLHWRKRYITLAPVATLIGLAFRLRDPEHLLGDREELGITCALVPAKLPGVVIGERHDPMGVPFMNGPIRGDDVFVPLDAIVGGRSGAGRGWRMLMESLAAGRSISLPSLSVGGAKVATRVVTAYAMVREQFDTPIGRFEGVEEPISRIAGRTYLMEAARWLTVGAVDAGEKPAVLSAVVKAWLTDALRDVTDDAMDVRAGAAIQRGPRNLLSRVHAAAPIGITVEGANILTRSMIIYGQGAIRCHPFALEEMRAVESGDLERFDRAFFGHVAFTLRNALRAPLLGLSGGRLAQRIPRGPTRRLFQRLERLTAAFALVSDAAMIGLGAALKRREKISGRLADVLAWNYLASATLKRFHDDGQPAADLAIARFACETCFERAEAALDGILRNLPNRAAAAALRLLALPLGRREFGPSDHLGGEVARAVLDDPGVRERLTAGIHRPPPEELGLGRLDAALAEAKAALPIEAKLRRAVREGLLAHAPGDALAREARAQGLLGEDELALLRVADLARDEAIQVDAFAPEEFPRGRGSIRRPGIESRPIG